jgi:hypothetical protein
MLDDDCWFDAAGYNLLLAPGGWHFSGGVRKRLFGRDKGDTWPLLSKYPFFRMDDDVVIFNHHWHWPYDTTTPAPQGALIHLKIMDDLAERAARYVREGQHFRGSEDYRLISSHLDSQPDVVAFHSQSVRYRGPKSLVRQHFMLPIDWHRPVRKQELEQERKRLDEVRSAAPGRRDWVETFPDAGGGPWLNQDKFNWVSHSTLSEQLEIVRCRGPLAPGEIGAICVVDDMAGLPSFFAHYKKLGVNRFFIAGTEAACGSQDIALAEPSADLFQACASLAEGFGGIYWANGIAREFCRGCWTVRAAADELLVYDRMEERTLADLAHWLAARDCDRVFALTIDLYAEDGSARSGSPRWFDGEGYREEERKGGWLVSGGVRRRLARDAASDADWLSRYPFVHILPEVSIADEHFLWPVSPRKPAAMAALLKKMSLGQSAGPVRYAGSSRYDGLRSLIRRGLIQPIAWDR